MAPAKEDEQNPERPGVSILEIQMAMLGSAQAAWTLYQSYQECGFTKAQAFELTKEFVSASLLASGD